MESRRLYLKIVSTSHIVHHISARRRSLHSRYDACITDSSLFGQCFCLWLLDTAFSYGRHLRRIALQTSLPGVSEDIPILALAASISKASIPLSGCCNLISCRRPAVANNKKHLEHNMRILNPFPGATARPIHNAWTNVASIEFRPHAHRGHPRNLDGRSSLHRKGRKIPRL